jgi:23S rRNA (guanine745-N1)-methyltransferase
VLADVVHLLRCPHCGGDLMLGEGAVRCASGHSFDVARQGYVSLTAAAGDSAAMVAAREAFLGAGHYAPITGAVKRHVLPEGPVVDLGAGTGHHLAEVLGGDQVALALDSSKYALRRAARLPRVGAVGADVWQDLPVKDGAAGTVLSIFSPRNGPEIARILAGRLIVVTPTQRHLRELVERHGLVTVDPLKRERLEEQLASLTRTHDELVEFELRLATTDANALIDMGPSAHHEHARVEETVATAASVELTVWQH